MEPLQGVENDIARKKYVPSSFKNSSLVLKHWIILERAS